MKIAVTDACIFSDIHGLRLTPDFFSLPFSFHTAVDVYNDLPDGHQQVLQAFVSVDRLSLHSLSGEERVEMHKENFPKSFSENDKAVMFIARRVGAMVLSNYKVIRAYAGKNAINNHGMLWLFDKFVQNGILSKQAAKAKLADLVNENFIYQNNQELMQEVMKRQKLWN